MVKKRGIIAAGKLGTGIDAEGASNAACCLAASFAGNEAQQGCCRLAGICTGRREKGCILAGLKTKQNKQVLTKQKKTSPPKKKRLHQAVNFLLLEGK